MKRFIITYKVFDILSGIYIDSFLFVETCDIYQSIGQLVLTINKPVKDFKYYEVVKCSG